MLVCTIYILVGMAITTTIIELVRLVLLGPLSNWNLTTAQERICWELEEDAGAESSDPGSAEAGRSSEKAGRGWRWTTTLLIPTKQQFTFKTTFYRAWWSRPGWTGCNSEETRKIQRKIWQRNWVWWARMGERQQESQGGHNYILWNVSLIIASAS